MNRCPKGHLLGLNLLSEVFVDPSSTGNVDLFVSDKFIGVRRGLLRPRRILMVSQRVRKLVETERFRGWQFEVVRNPVQGGSV